MRWPLQPLQPPQQTQIQPPFGQSVDSLCHPWFTTTNLSYRFPVLKLQPPPCAVLLVLQSLHKVRPSTTLYYKACALYVPVLFCSTTLVQSTSQYYFVLQSLGRVLPSTTLYYKACTKHVPVQVCTTKLAQNNSQYYFALLTRNTFHMLTNPYRSLDAATPLRFTMSSCKRQKYYARSCPAKQPGRSHYNAFCSITWPTLISLRTW